MVLVGVEVEEVADADGAFGNADVELQGRVERDVGLGVVELYVVYEAVEGCGAEEAVAGAECAGEASYFAVGVAAHLRYGGGETAHEVCVDGFVVHADELRVDAGQA